MPRIRSYSELRRLPTFKERFDYLSLRSQVGAATFGFDRWMNQGFYNSSEWKRARAFVIARDEGCDLGLAGYDIMDQLYIHHMNPMGRDDLIEFNPANLDPEFLITTCHRTHNAIHYGDESQLPREYTPRRAGDTKLW